MSESTGASREATVERWVRLLAERGRGAYFDEPVTQTEHMLQAAAEGETRGEPASLVVAALLHDVGHLLHDGGEDVAHRGIDARHEEIAARHLEADFPPAVVEPVRLHVAAKRYLCHREAGYADALSPASRQSLELQGGPMSAAEAEAFRARPFADEAVRLRRLDEAAKVEGAATPDLEHYRAVIASVLA